MTTPKSFLAVVREPAATLATAAELTHLDRTPIDFQQICVQHAAYVFALQQMGAQLLTLPALERFPDSVFVEDAAVMLDGVAVLTRPGVASREAEADLLREPIGRCQPAIVQIQTPGTLDGGDVLKVGRTLFVGASTRSNVEGIRQLAAIAEPLGYRVQAIALGPSLHLKTAVTALDEHTVVWNPAWLPSDAFAGFERIAVDSREPFGANVLRLPTGWVVNAAFPRTAERVLRHAARRGVCTETVDISEFGKAEAGLTCLSLIAPYPPNA